jgi:flagella basal body P-ring formation protein FlgA
VSRLLAAILLCSAGPALAEGLVAVRERASASGALILLSDLARIDGFAEAQASELGALEVGRAPRPGRTRELSGTRLRRLVERAAPGASVDVPERVWVSSEARTIEPDWLRARLEHAISRRMPWPAEAVALRDWQLPEPFAVSPRATRLQVRFRADEDFSGTIPLELEFLDPSAPDAPGIRRSAGVRAAVSLPVVVLTQSVRRGAALEDPALRIERRELERVPRDALRELADALGQRAVRDLAAGQVLVREALVLDPVVQRGDTVLVESGSGALEVRVLARALERGAPGQRIRLENPTTRQRLEAEVTGPGAARLLLPGVATGR